MNSELDNKKILMLHGLSGTFTETLHTGKASCQQIESALAIAEYFPELLIDQFTFTPKGYSLNAINGSNYLTIHITPEKLSTYLSLESSFKSPIIQPYIRHLIRLFCPSQSHLMSFSKGNEDELQVTVENI
jgi:S-adenosylmethionine decarboxylase